MTHSSARDSTGDPSKENKSYWRVLKIYSREWSVYKRGLEYIRSIFSKFETTWISHKERLEIALFLG